MHRHARIVTTLSDTLHNQVFSVVPVRIEVKKCVHCNVAAVPGDDWREQGYFVFDGVAVHMAALVVVRESVQSGTPITTVWGDRLRRLRNNLRWLTLDPNITKR